MAPARALIGCFAIMLVLTACGGGGGSPPPPPAVSVSISPLSASVNISATQAFSATVVNASNTAVTWTVSGSGCTGAACGTISSGGVYTAPAVAPTPNAITITATAQADTAKSATASVTIMPLSVSVSPTVASVEVGTTKQFVANVTGSNTSVSWSVNGTVGGDSTVGTISGSGVYTAPGTVPNPATVTVTAISQADNTKSASAQVSVVHFSKTTLNGHYAFQMQGSTAAGAYFAAGYFIADGNGNLTGAEDVNAIVNATGALSTSNFTGSYTIDDNGVGTATITIGGVATTWAFVMNGNKATGQFIEYDTAGVARGTFYKQDTALFNNAAINGNYVFSVSGTEPGTNMPIRIVGGFTAGGAGDITSGTEDIKEGGSFLSLIPFSGTYTVDNNGRALLKVNDTPALTTYILYVVDSHWSVLLATNPFAGLGTVGTQTGTFSASSLSGNYVFTFSGVTFSGTNTIAGIGAVGLLNANGAGALTGTVEAIEGGAPLTSTSVTGTYSVASNGRGEAALSSATTTTHLVFWLVDGANILALYEDFDRVEGGPIKQQSGSFSNGSFSGSYSDVGIGSGTSGTLTAVGRIVSDGAGSVTASERLNDSGALSTLIANGTYTVDSSGRATISVDKLMSNAVLYFISTDEAYMLGQLNGSISKQF